MLDFVIQLTEIAGVLYVAIAFAAHAIKWTEHEDWDAPSDDAEQARYNRIVSEIDAIVGEVREIQDAAVSFAHNCSFASN